MSFATEEPRVAQVGIGAEIDQKALWVVLSCSCHLKGGRDEEKGSDGGSGASLGLGQSTKGAGQVLPLDVTAGPWHIRLHSVRQCSLT